MISASEPGRTKNLLSYMSFVAMNSLKYTWPSWVVYDLNFRQEAADSGLKDWSKVDPNIYTQWHGISKVTSLVKELVEEQMQRDDKTTAYQLDQMLVDNGITI